MMILKISVNELCKTLYCCSWYCSVVQTILKEYGVSVIIAIINWNIHVLHAERN